MGSERWTPERWTVGATRGWHRRMPRHGDGSFPTCSARSWSLARSALPVLGTLLVLGALLILPVPARAAMITVSLVNPGSSTVAAGVPVVLEVRATFDTRLSAVAFALSASGPAAAEMTARSLAPTGSNGLTYVSPTSQAPYVSNLPHDLKAAPLIEVAYDDDFGVLPGGAADGLPAGGDVLIEEITIVPDGTGSVDITLGSVSAAHTTTSAAGTLFHVAGVGVGTIQLTVIGMGDRDGDGDVDLDDYQFFPACLTGPDQGPIGGGCGPFDFDVDDDVDLLDFAEFAKIFTGSLLAAPQTTVPPAHTGATTQPARPTRQPHG